MGKQLTPGMLLGYLHTGLGGGCVEGGSAHAALAGSTLTACLHTAKVLPA